MNIFQKNIIKFGKKSATASEKINNELVHNEEYLKSKIKSYKGKINTKKLSMYLYISNTN